MKIGDWRQGQQIADAWQGKRIHRKLDEFAQRFCPIFAQLGVQYHWSIDQCEYATDIVFHRQADLGAIYENLTRTAIHSVKADNIATFLGKKLHGNYQDEMGNRFTSASKGRGSNTPWDPLRSSCTTIWLDSANRDHGQ